MKGLDFSDRFTRYVEESNYRSVKRYLDRYVFDHQTYNKVLYKSIINEDDKMFIILSSDFLVEYNMTFDVCFYLMTYKEKGKYNENDYLPYIKRLINIKPGLLTGVDSRDLELLDTYKQISRLRKFIRIKKKIHNLK